MRCWFSGGVAARRYPRGTAPQPAYAGASATSAYGASNERPWGAGSGATVEMPAAPSDLERGIANIRTMDPGLDTLAITDQARRVYFVVQQAIGMRELAGVRDYLMPEMITVLQTQCDRLPSRLSPSGERDRAEADRAGDHAVRRS